MTMDFQRYAGRRFAIVYETKTKKIRRLIDTHDDPDDSHLSQARKFLAADETMETFPMNDFPVRLPRFVAPYIGKGTIV